MKKYVVIVAVLFGLLSCKKDHELNMLKENVIGTWEMHRYSGYPFNQPPVLPGNGHIMVIGKDGSFERKLHDTLLYRGKYVLLKRKDCYKRVDDITFSTTDNPDSYSYISMEGDRLVFSTPNCYQDGGSTSFIRISQGQ
ncbi:MAG: hypothetical protein EOP53_04775 [Sphingobacteriales bacterium]|nr:MAG: hypothetical protein EOP53_04775 [Sphingobacteriales bacterium]